MADSNRFSIHTSHKTILLLPFLVYVGLVLIVAVFPAIDLERRYPPNPSSRIGAGSELVKRGEGVFISLGCPVCHTQQIRGDERVRVQLGERLVHPVREPDARFGLDEPTRPEDYADSHPPLLGTQRTGPDLTGVGDRLPSVVWHYWHLYDPRSVSPDSVMPSYRELFRIAPAGSETCTVDEPPSLVLSLAILIGLTVLFGLLGWALFGFSLSMALALVLGFGAGWLVVDKCRACEFQPTDCELIEEGIDALGLPQDARLVATPDAKALTEYLLSLRRPAKKPQ
jgi:cbb3-type cytochrome oxidase cytochrome c subunit